MFVALREIPPDIAKVKYFHFDVMDRRMLDRANIVGHSISDTTEVSSSSTTETTLKSYGFSVGANTNSIRVKLYGRSPDTANATTYNIYIDGTLVASQTITGITDISLIIDYIGDLSPGSHTVEIRAYNAGGATFYVSKVYIIAGLKIDSTTPVTLVSLIGLDTEYTLQVNGNFTYRLGVRYWIKGNRKTTASATVTSNLANEIEGVHRNLGAGDDDGEIFLTIRTGDFRPDPAISMAVGATGDIIIVTGVFVQVTVSRRTEPISVLINEMGVVYGFIRHVTVDGTGGGVCWIGETKNTIIYRWCASGTTDALILMNPVPVRPGIGISPAYSHDTDARMTPLVIEMVVIAS